MIYVILGQTASGKTGLALKLAKELHLPLIGADAFQVYQELNIGSAKPKKEELSGIENYLIDDRSVKNPINVKEYQKEVRSLLDSFQKEGKDVILSGGTFLYVKAALYPFEFTEEEEKDDDNLDSLSKEELSSLLEKEDPQTYQVIDRNNLRRMVRAIRIARSGKKKSEIVKENKKILYPAEFFSIEVDREEGNKRIDQRVEQMFKDGLLKEAEELKASFDLSYSSFQAIGYKEIFQGLKEHQSEEEIKEQIKIDTRQYAKRQRTFLRHQFPEIHFMKSEEIEKAVLFEAARRRRNQISLSPETLSQIERASVTLVGVGGVGSIVADGLIRLGVRNLTLIDKDTVDPSNMNRQLLYVAADCQKEKAEAAKEHLLEINPLAHITSLVTFYSDELLDEGTDFVFDCIDDVKAKAKMIIYCRNKGIKMISATGSGLRKDATKFRIGSLKDTGEPLAKALKKELESLGLTDFEKVNIAYSYEQPAKREDKEIGSNFLAPNGEGLALLSFFVSSFSD
jgi:tRNA dimethylallyltransferase